RDEGKQRRLGLVRVVFVQIAKIALQEAPALRVGLALGFGGDQLRELVETLLALKQGGQRLEALAICTVAFAYVLPGVDRGGRITDHARLQGRDAHVIAPRVRVAFGGACAQPERFDQLRPALGGFERRAQAVERLRVARIGRQTLPPGGDRALRLVQRHRDARRRPERRAPAIGFALQIRQALEHVELALGRALAFEQTIELPGGRQRELAICRFREHACVALDRARTVRERVLLHGGGVEYERERHLAIGRAVRDRREQLRQPLFGADLARQRRELIALLARAGLERHELRDVFERARGVRQAGELELDDRAQAIGALLGILRELELHFQHAG